MSDEISNVLLKRKRNDEEVISIQDALNDQLEEEKNLIEEAKRQEEEDWGDENCCSFEKGYINQSVFACRTCSTDDRLFGFCYGCSMHCHLYHDIYELFHKKDFRCDCGTLVQQPKEGDQKKEFLCQLAPISKDENGEQIVKKEILNSKNQYNHNFKGKYCYCDSVYDYKEDMIQCILCMDWFHEQCLKLNSKVSDIPSVDEFSDLICSDCVKKFNFLQYYPYIRVYIVNDHIVIDDPPKADIENKTTVTTTTTTTTKTTTTTTTTATEATTTSSENITGSGLDLVTPPLNITSANTTSESTINKLSVNSNRCKKSLIGPNSLFSGDLFCKENWTSDLCQCGDCKIYYKENKLEFLFEGDSNTISHRESLESSVEGDKDIFNKTQDTFEKIVPLQQQRALLEGYSNMKEKLKDFFSKKADTNQVITKQRFECK
ncbi:hypothetical protein DICPUDRAFT_153611 [Dictyostelium purpureum]|uniref:UBR-type domain-containing protein n=1 Tax=Dictyostelium purpureum TaxID=5786 RepID=F0ZPB5_DICPU|nr:uncharacterized protein DICPUDRAFT_153611 [Dictyostelium purpureum]EGC34214.1 hypothetical protein DICPUDRAFT_153611 [Dictyostelium purpureum]|eukprot:XP_003289266.1 hypothetical protein DICPUDRAFT_153611 [Dictyostelium purpureum]